MNSNNDYSKFSEIMECLERNKKGTIIKNSRNVMKILESDLFDGLAFDEFKYEEVFKNKLPWRDKRNQTAEYDQWLGSDDGRLRFFLDSNFNITGVGMIMDTFKEKTHRNTFHPIKQYIESIKWDGVARLETLFIDFLGAEDTKYIRTVTRKQFIAGVARIYEPGCKFDNMLVLVGKQELGKSYLIDAMGRQWFCDSIKKLESKEAGEYLQRSWIVEFGEMTHMSKSSVEEIKHFITKRNDSYRVAYDRTVSDFPRHCIFFGTTNNKNFLKDETGNRRFWVVDVGTTKSFYTTYDLTDEYIDQVWAEAKFYYDKGELLTLDDEMKKIAEAIQFEHMEENPRLDSIKDYLEDKAIICIRELWDKCLKLPNHHDIPRKEYADIKSILTQLGWIKTDKRERVETYGKVDVFINKEMI